ncbi:MAG: low molecular weight phosphotyrosine protein phosphatase [Verrucomicrobiae bacterium]|nr:low molecular weight phosphotyrosine protein phosphatase [Verrucomicrobiae bacterium]NNJ44306.1 low molecular weight phosphotyrosine protein phosphatase [Akkermansiaceae bacterium]
MPRTPFNVLFVCLGNICRSPAGENIFRHLVESAELESKIHTDSAGTHDYQIGNAPDRRMKKTLQNRGIPSSGTARQFTEDDFLNYDLILTMDTDNYRHVTALDPDGSHRDKVIRFTDFCDDLDHQVTDVPDPYYGNGEGFEKVADMIEDGCQQLLAHVRKELS